MEINRNNINEIVRKSGANPSKDYGQNFLIEPTLASQIVGALDMEAIVRILSKVLWMLCMLMIAGAASLALGIVIMYATYSVLIAI